MAAPPIPIAVFFSNFSPGGTEGQMLQLVRRLDPRRFAVHVACFAATGEWRTKVPSTVAPIAEFPIFSFRHPATWRQMLAFARWCRAHRIAVVQTTDFYTNVFALAGSALARVPVRVGSRRELNPDKSIPKLVLQRCAYATAHVIVANSFAARARLAAELVDSSMVFVIRNGVELRDVPPRRSPEHIRRIITVANLRAEKAHETLIAGAALMSDQPDLEFQIVGDGPRRQHLEGLARERGVADRVHFLGYRSDVPALLAAADLFVLPSRSEASPNVVLEAMAAGLPIVACRLPALRELVEEGTTGILVPPDDPPALARAILSLRGAPAKAAELGRAARLAAERGHSFDRLVASFEALYLSALAGSARGQLRAASEAGVPDAVR